MNTWEIRSRSTEHRRQAGLIVLHHRHLAGLQIGGQELQRLIGDSLQRVRLPMGLLRSGKVEEVGDHPVEPIDLPDHDRGISLFLGLPVETLHEILGKPLDGTQGIADFMRHARGQTTE